MTHDLLLTSHLQIQTVYKWSIIHHLKYNLLFKKYDHALTSNRWSSPQSVLKECLPVQIPGWLE